MRRGWIACLGLGLAMTAAGAAPGPVTDVGLFLPVGKSQKGPLDKLWHTVTPFVFKAANRKYRYVTFEDRASMVKAIRAGTLAGMYSTDYTAAIEGAMAGTLQPWAAFSTYGTSRVKDCVYVNVNSPYKSIKDLKGKKMLTYDREYTYQELWSMTGQRPETFFSPLTPALDGQSMLFAVALGDTDAAFVNSFNEMHLKATNPGPVKKIRTIGCGIDTATSPVLFSPDMAKDDREKILKRLFTLQNDPEAKKDAGMRPYMGLVKLVKFSFVPSSAKDVEGLTALIREARKAGRTRYYEGWLKVSAKAAKKRMKHL